MTGLLRTLWLAGASPVIRYFAVVWPALTGLAFVQPAFFTPRVCTHRARPEPDHSLSCHHRVTLTPARTGFFCLLRAGVFTDLSMIGRLYRAWASL